MPRPYSPAATRPPDPPPSRRRQPAPPPDPPAPLRQHLTLLLLAADAGLLSLLLGDTLKHPFFVSLARMAPVVLGVTLLAYLERWRPALLRAASNRATGVAAAVLLLALGAVNFAPLDVHLDVSAGAKVYVDSVEQPSVADLRRDYPLDRDLVKVAVRGFRTQPVTLRYGADGAVADTLLLGPLDILAGARRRRGIPADPRHELSVVIDSAHPGRITLTGRIARPVRRHMAKQHYLERAGRSRYAVQFRLDPGAPRLLRLPADTYAVRLARAGCAAVDTTIVVSPHEKNVADYSELACRPPAARAGRG